MFGLNLHHTHTPSMTLITSDSLIAIYWPKSIRLLNNKTSSDNQDEPKT